jgi:hypothetical protein
MESDLIAEAGRKARWVARRMRHPRWSHRWHGRRAEYGGLTWCERDYLHWHEWYEDVVGTMVDGSRIALPILRIFEDSGEVVRLVEERGEGITSSPRRGVKAG